RRSRPCRRICDRTFMSVTVSRKPETRLQLRIRRRLREEVGGWWFKVHGGPFQQSGIPDIIGCTGGLFFSFEVKVDDEKGDPLQEETMADIREEGGGVAIVVRSPEEAIRAVKKTLATARRVPTRRSKVRPLPKGVRV